MDNPNESAFACVPRYMVENFAKTYASRPKLGAPSEDTAEWASKIAYLATEIAEAAMEDISLT